MAKNMVGRILLGSALAVAGLSLYVYFDENTRSKVESYINREKAKYFIRQNLNGSEKLLSAVDTLSDQELTSLMKLLDNTQDFVSKASDNVTSTVNRVKELGEDVKGKIKTVKDDFSDQVSKYKS